MAGGLIGPWKTRWYNRSPCGLRKLIDVKVHADGSNPAGGQASQAMGRTKGGLNTKIHALVDARSQPIVIALSSGNQADISVAAELTDCLLQDSTLIGDKSL
jgi:Transposase DDE domain